MPLLTDDNPQSDANLRWKDGFSDRAWGCLGAFLLSLVTMAIGVLVWIVFEV